MVGGSNDSKRIPSLRWLAFQGSIGNSNIQAGPIGNGLLHLRRATTLADEGRRIRGETGRAWANGGAATPNRWPIESSLVITGGADSDSIKRSGSSRA
jgi:hypothetical protein